MIDIGPTSFDAMFRIENSVSLPFSEARASLEFAIRAPRRLE